MRKAEPRQRQRVPSAVVLQDNPEQQSLPPMRQNWSRIWQRQVPMVEPMGRSQSIAPQHSKLLMQLCPLVWQTQRPPEQRDCPQHSPWVMQSTGGSVMVRAGKRQQVRPMEG